MAVSIVSFSFSRAAQPEAQGPSFLLSAGFFYHILSPTGLVPKLHRGSRGPLRPSVAFPTASCLQRLWSPTVWLPALTELYNSSSPTQSPTQSLEWFRNNCHAVHMSLSSGASVYECTMGILPCPILLTKSTYAISPHKCHRNVSLPSGASLWNGIFGQVEGQYILMLTNNHDTHVWGPRWICHFSWVVYYSYTRLRRWLLSLLLLLMTWYFYKRTL